ncbi:unnamed protein product [Cyclocybe aegerita]|uniref:Uncharacterized protein n=1 Tax=Cyclocybe aegerita TaxID=1973307 RepID=A0A8S0XNX8_CYCAE|nr:unnamed protein product [Cyclocybe aegerita]
MRLVSIVSVIKTHLATLESPSQPTDAIPAHMVPSDADFLAALKVLRYLQLPQIALSSDPATPIESVVAHIESHWPVISAGARGAANKKEDLATYTDTSSMLLITSTQLLLECLKDGNKPPKLDILFNNAAQTLTDSTEKEQASIQREISLQSSALAGLILGGSYSPRIKVNDEFKAISIISQDTLSSWTQRISDIPYEDVISAHSVNTFVPFILVRELLPFMSAPALTSPSDSHSQRDDAAPSKPFGYIINVSSREGLFEDSPDHRAKDGYHVHTNMSKAALNMLTETEAGPAWKNGRVAMNTVDPGYMSADPVFMEKQAPPIRTPHRVCASSPSFWASAKTLLRLPTGATSLRTSNLFTQAFTARSSGAYLTPHASVANMQLSNIATFLTLALAALATTPSIREPEKWRNRQPRNNLQLLLPIHCRLRNLKL